MQITEFSVLDGKQPLTTNSNKWNDLDNLPVSVATGLVIMA